MLAYIKRSGYFQRVFIGFRTSHKTVLKPNVRVLMIVNIVYAKLEYHAF